MCHGADRSNARASVGRHRLEGLAAAADSRGAPGTFTPGCCRDEGKLQQWSAFVRDLSAQVPPFETVISELAAFIAPVTVEARALLQKEGRCLRVLLQRR